MDKKKSDAASRKVEAQKMYERADLDRLGYVVVVVSREHKWVIGPDTMTKVIYVVPKNKVNGPSYAKEFVVKFLKGTAAVVSVTLDGEPVKFKPWDTSSVKVDFLKLETNTQKMDRLEKEVASWKRHLKRHLKRTLKGLGKRMVEIDRENAELRAFGKKYCKHLPNCCSTSKGCHCEMSQEIKRLGVM